MTKNRETHGKTVRVGRSAVCDIKLRSRLSKNVHLSRDFQAFEEFK